MKHIILLFPCLFFLMGIMKAQDFEPSRQAQGYLDSKNIMVDYATGIFHYKLSLFTLGSGDFQLPVSLDYSARGVREEDHRGIVGYNWMLNTGGVVTRTIRGGIADETSHYGYLWADRGNNVTPLIEDVTNVNKRERDGECDIFTAVFNGQSVNFIIKMDENYRIYTEPLEQTNVRVECESANGREIDGWIVTDESGNRYIYRQKEYSVDIIKEDAISFNGIRNQTYVSSWYLNRIEPYNKKPIVFTYLAEVRPSEKNQEEVNTMRFYSMYKSKYSYGKMMRERVFDFSKYKTEFDQDIREAKRYLNSFSLEMQLNNELYKYIGNGEWIRNPNFEAGLSAISANFRIMGQVANFTSITNASNELIQTLNQLISMYGNSSSHNANMAATFFRSAKSCVTRSLNEMNNNVSTKETSGGTAFDIKSPILERITCDGKFVEFEYSNLWGTGRLSRVRLTDIFQRVISEVVVNGGEQLIYLSVLDKEGAEVNRIKFDYYKQVASREVIADVWGYFRQRQGDDDDGFSQNVDAEYSKIGSLKTITVPNGGKMTIDYESNSFGNGFDFGGIRVKSLLVDDDKSNTHDTIYYRYPQPGRPVFSRVSNQEAISYAGFNDHVMYSRMKYTNLSFVNTGNNGLYYPYVQEITKGKGTKAYLFNVFSPSYLRYPHAFWLTGLPLATATYDNNGNLKELVKFKYISDLSGATTSGYFNPIDTAVNYKQMIPQVKAYEYYMDEKFLEDYYRNQGRIFLYQDGNSSYYINPYEESYVYNIKPRTSVRLPEQVYYIKYGGKTLLKEKVAYRFETHVTDSATISDFTSKATGIPYQRIEYFYDNIKGSSYPTRVSTTDTRGDMYTTVTKRVTEMGNAASPVFETMKQKNILVPVIKEIQLKGDTIQKESVSVYEMLEEGDYRYLGLSQKYAFYPISVKSLSFSSLLSPDLNLFTQGQTNYVLEQTVGYQQNNQRYLPVSVKTNAGESARCYDFNYGYTILKAEHTKAQSVIAVDLKKYNEEPQLRDKVSNFLRVYTVFEDFYELYQGIDRRQLSDEFRRYAGSEGHYMMQDLIRVVASKKSMALENFHILVDSVRANRERHLHDFYENYMQLATEKPELTRLSELVRNICNMISHGITRDADILKYRSLTGMQNYLSCTAPFEITILPEIKCMRLFVVAKGYASYVYYTVVHSGGRASGNFQLSDSLEYTLQSFDLDLNTYKDVTSVIISQPSSRVAYFALVPDNVPFEATSYNLDGSVFCRFNQNGKMELNEYDSAGRVIRVKDQHGDIISEYQYNVVKQK